MLREVREQLASWESGLIETAREQGASWAELAGPLGVASRQAAERRYLRLRPGTIRYAADPADIAQDPLFESSGTGCRGSLERRSPRPRVVKIRLG